MKPQAEDQPIQAETQLKTQLKTRAAVLALLESLPVDLNDPELDRTPERVAELWHSALLSGDGDGARALSTRIPAPSRAVVTLTDLPFHCVCPHHLTPTFGRVHLAYEPGDWIVGLGALSDLVLAYSRRVVLQETLTEQLVGALMEHLGARGAACAIEAQHLCMSLRGRSPLESQVWTRIGKGSLKDRHDVLPLPRASARPS